MRDKLKDPMHITQVMSEYLEELEQQATSPGGLFHAPKQEEPCPKS